MSEVKLKPCPFCGGEANAFVDRYNKYFTGCESCNFYYGIEIEDGCELENGWVAIHNSVEEAIEAWNTRKPMEDIVERLEKHKSYNQMMLKKFPKMGTIENAIYKTQRDTYENAIEIVKGGVEDGETHD